jgi:hypothetical protein
MSPTLIVKDLDFVLSRYEHMTLGRNDHVVGQQLLNVALLLFSNWVHIGSDLADVSRQLERLIARSGSRY